MKIKRKEKKKKSPYAVIPTIKRIKTRRPYFTRRISGLGSKILIDKRILEINN